jgi:hypothetical protein
MKWKFFNKFLTYSVILLSGRYESNQSMNYHECMSMAFVFIETKIPLEKYLRECYHQSNILAFFF